MTRIDMISFDIFDTLITRTTYSPQGIFLLVQQKLLNELDVRNMYYFCNNFFNLRVNAEKDARIYAEQSEKEEVTLDEIYDLLTYRNSISKELSECIKQWEIQAEIENTYPITKSIRLLKKYLLEKKRVVLISDMYLDENTIRKLLLVNDPIFQDIPIYVSSKKRKTKRSGSLYFEVAKEENISFSNWIHFGDNKSSDYLTPRMLGIDARHMPFKGLTLWENELGKNLGLKNNLIAQLYFGIARNLRLDRELDSSEIIGGSVGGMILYPYVIWLLRKSLEMKVKRLYFIARDGYILKEIADLFIKNQCLDIHTTYIYGSRRAWRLDGFNENEKKMVIMYLSQEVDFSDSNFAFVDLHGTGITMECLASVILKYFGMKTKVFYFDLIDNRISDSNLFIPFCSHHSGIVELFCRAPHGATIGYEQKEGKIIPKLQPIDKIYWEKANLYSYFEGVKSFADKISRYCWGYWLEDINLVETVIEYCEKMPCRDFQNFIGDIPHYDGIEDEKVKYAPILSVKDIFRIYMWRTVEDISEYYSGVNLNLSLMRSSLKCNELKLYLEKNYTFLLGKCMHKLKNRRKNYEGINRNLVIYGAGNVGKRLYEHLITISGFNILGWTDLDDEKYQQLGYPVVTVQKVLKLNFHYIIIAVGDLIRSKQISKNLQGLGISEEKIMYYKEFLEKYDKLILHQKHGVKMLRKRYDL